MFRHVKDGFLAVGRYYLKEFSKTDKTILMKIEILAESGGLCPYDLIEIT